jgi:hypothetical protein
MAFVSLYQIFWEFSGPKLWSLKLRKMNISDNFFFTSSIEAQQLLHETFMSSTEKTLLLTEQPKNDLRASRKALFT